MDGFEKTHNILVIGATNHEDALDPAAVRPGWFDKKVHVPHPDLKGWKDIFELYLAKIKKESDVDAEKLAKMCVGFTGADIENLVNTAISEAVHHDKVSANMQDFEQARDRIMMGIERKSLTIEDKEWIKTAIHESGHAIACYFTPGALKLYKATIVSWGHSLGATFMEPSDSEVSMSKEEVMAHIDVAMGGHVAERMILGDKLISSGCGSDL